MIEQLLVKDYVLFDREQVDFDNQMTVITGETGAGKSLLIDAIGYLTGNRLSGNVVRPGAQKAVLQMILSEPSQQALDLLRENDFEPEDEILITRTIFPNGKSRIQVNGQNATNAFVKKLSELFIDIHSQMDTIKLIQPEVQLELLDLYAGNQNLLEEVGESYRQLSKARSELTRLQKETFSDEELERLTRALNEIDQAAIQPDEYETLSERIKETSGFQKNLEDFSLVLYELKKDGGALDSMAGISKILRRNHALDSLADQSYEIYHQLLDIQAEIEEKKEMMEELSAELDQMMERQHQIKTLFRKYGGSYEQLQKTREKIESRISRIIHRQEVFEQLEKRVSAFEKDYFQKANALSRSRKEHFASLQEQIIKHAKDLMLENIRFEIHHEPKKESANGIDEIEFYASMNPGQPLSPLRQAGSGGELSRLMLALKTVFQAKNGITTLIFDEIDTGVSGKVALAMGNKMNALAKNYQVLSITHLPSVAVWADHHLRVVKTAKENLTATEVEVLDEDKHFEELAIMSSGSAQSDVVESMKQLSQRIHHG